MEKENWYQQLLCDLKNLAWTKTIEIKHAIGKRILEDELKFGKPEYGKKRIENLAKDLDGNIREIYRCIQFARQYPELSDAVRKLSWRETINNLLPEKCHAVTLSEPLLPIKDKYQCIVIDPPWNYGTKYDNQTRRVASPYPEISTEELKKFKLPSDDNCILWLWTTHKFLPDAFELIKIWNFEYKLTFVWDKQKMGMGAWLRCQAEFCLLGIKGNPKWNLTNERDILSVARREHSRKPNEFYELVNKLCPTKYKIDIFSREKREEWSQYGNEINKLG